ncbi:MAG: polynucleotide adenylyltransferase PcnB, partial [Burkholderiaceae bacterium]
LRTAGLHHGLLPLLDVVLEQPLGEKFVTLALNATDERIRQGKPVSPGFLFAALLWHQALEKWKAYQASGEYPIPALHLAADDVLHAQTDKLALQRKIASDMREIWAMQPRFERRIGKSPYKLLEHPRWRAGYDFLLLRCASGELDAELGEWWTAFVDADGAGREALLQKKPQAADAPTKRSRRRSRRGKSGQTDATGAATSSEAVQPPARPDAE